MKFCIQTSSLLFRSPTMLRIYATRQAIREEDAAMQLANAQEVSKE